MRQFGHLVMLPQMSKAQGTAKGKQNGNPAHCCDEQGLEKKKQVRMKNIQDSVPT